MLRPCEFEAKDLKLRCYLNPPNGYAEPRHRNNLGYFSL